MIWISYWFHVYVGKHRSSFDTLSCRIIDITIVLINHLKPSLILNVNGFIFKIAHIFYIFLQLYLCILIFRKIIIFRKLNCNRWQRLRRCSRNQRNEAFTNMKSRKFYSTVKEKKSDRIKRFIRRIGTLWRCDLIGSCVRRVL